MHPVRIKCNRTQWKKFLLDKIRELNKGHKILLCDFQQPDDKEWCRKFAEEQGLKVTDRAETLLIEKN